MNRVIFQCEDSMEGILTGVYDAWASEVGPAILAVIFIAASFFLLERAVRVFGIGMSYGVFTGLGIAGTSIIGILALGESISVVKIISLIILMTGIVGIKFCDGKEEGKGAEEK